MTHRRRPGVQPARTAEFFHAYRAASFAIAIG